MSIQRSNTIKHLTLTLFLGLAACGGTEATTPMVSPFHGTWQYITGEYHMRCPVDPPLDINLTGKRMGLTQDQHVPAHLWSGYFTPCDRTGRGGLIWTIRGTTATVSTSSCSDFIYRGTLSLSGETLTVDLSEVEDQPPDTACQATRKGTLTKLSTNPDEAKQ